MDKVYFDYAASTPVNPEVLEAMQPYFSDVFANPGSMHAAGRVAQHAIDSARNSIADIFGVGASGVIFTASATEANNLAIRGVVKAYLGQKPHIIASAVEHESVLDTARDLEQRGEAEVTYVGVDSHGFVNPGDIEKNIKPNTILVSVMQVNNVTGAIQPVKEVGALVKQIRMGKLQPKNYSRFAIGDLPYPVLHTDAAQAVNGPESIDVKNMGADMITISSHKICGPKGAAALILANSVSQIANSQAEKSAISHLPFAAKGVRPRPIRPWRRSTFGGAICPIITGGGQEFGLHSGTENVPAIVGFAKALELTMASRIQEHKRFTELKKRFVQGMQKAYPKTVVNSYEPCVPGIVNMSFPGFTLDELIYKFDTAGIAVSIGSACHAKLIQPSHVLQAMGVDTKRLHSALRFSFGRYTTQEEIDLAIIKIREMFS